MDFYIRYSDIYDMVDLKFAPRPWLCEDICSTYLSEVITRQLPVMPSNERNVQEQNDQLLQDLHYPWKGKAERQ